MSNNIFINYRRQLDSGAAGRIYDSLSRALPRAAIFMDVDKLNPGDDFEAALQRSLSSCNVLLAIIGPQWIDITTANGQKRLQDPDDFVRKEIRAGLNGGVRVIPVLVNGAKMPDKSTLPADLQSLTKRQAVEVRHERFNADVSALASAIAETMPRARPSKWRPVVLATTAALGLGVTGYFVVLPLLEKELFGTPLPGSAIKTTGCKLGFVWRNAVFGDDVCVTQSDHDEAMAQNANADNNRSPDGGPYGVNTCRSGYVWREANPSDFVCVTPFEREKASQQNAAGANHKL